MISNDTRIRSKTFSSPSFINNNNINNNSKNNNISYSKNNDHNYDIIKNEFYKLSNNILSIYDSINDFCNSIKSLYLNQNSYLNNSFNYYGSDHPISKYRSQVIPNLELIFDEWAINQSNNFQFLSEFCNQLDSIRLKIENYEASGYSLTSLKSEIFKDVKYQFECRVNGFDIPLINIQFSINSLLNSISTIQNDSSSNLQNKINYISPVSNINTINSNNNCTTINNNINSNNSNINKPPIYNNNNNNNISLTNNNNINSINKPTPSINKKATLKQLARPSSVEIPKVEAPDNMYRGEKEKDLPGQHITPPQREIITSPQQNKTPPPRLDLLKQQTRVNPPNQNITSQQPQPIRFQQPTPSTNNSDNIVPVRPAPIPNSNNNNNNNITSRPRAQSVNYSSPPLQNKPQIVASNQQVPPRPLPLFQKPQATNQSNNYITSTLQTNQPQIPLRPTPSDQQLPPVSSFQKPQPTIQSNSLPQQQSRPLPSFTRPQATSQLQNNNSLVASQPQNKDNNFAKTNHFTSNYIYERPLPAPKPKFQPYPLLDDKPAQSPVKSSTSSSSSSSSSKKGFSFSKLIKEIDNSNGGFGFGFGSVTTQGGYSCGLTGRPISNDPKIEDLIYDYEKHKQIFGNNKKFKLIYSYTQTIFYEKKCHQYTILNGNPVSSLLLYIFEPISMQSQNITNYNIVFSDSDGNVVEPDKIEHLQNILCAEFKSPKLGQTFNCTYEITADLYSCTLVNASSNEIIQVEPITEFEREFHTRPTPKLNFDKEEFKQFINDNFLYPQTYQDGSTENLLCFTYRCSLFIKYQVKYDYQSGDQEPLETISKGLGNCSSYSNLFASIMRYNGLPCRILSGLVCRKEGIPGGIPPAHAQNEVYLDNIGWLPYNGAAIDNASYNFMAYGRSFGDHFTLGTLKEKGILPLDKINLRDFQLLNIQPPTSYDVIKISNLSNDEDIQKIDNNDCQIV